MIGIRFSDWFIGGLHEHIFIYGHIRAGRAAVDKTRMIKLMAEAVAVEVIEQPAPGVLLGVTKVEEIRSWHLRPPSGRPFYCDAERPRR